MAITRPYLRPNAGGTKHEFIRLQGAAADQAQQVEVIERPGIDGVAFRTLGKKAGATTWVAIVDVSSADKAQRLVKALRGLQGEYVEMGDEIGTRFFNVIPAKTCRL